jgi:hypothetical protein
MVKTALNFAAGFFGIPNEGQYALEIAIEAPGLNTTGAPYFRTLISLFLLRSERDTKLPVHLDNRMPKF